MTAPKARLEAAERPVVPEQGSSALLRYLGATLALAGVLLLAVGVVVGRGVLDQASELSSRLAATDDLADANVRTLGQAQRELLRLEVALSTGASRSSLRLHEDLVTQRVNESALSYQLKTLGSQKLLDQAIAARDRWNSALRANVRRASLTPVGSDERKLIITLLSSMEGTYNWLAAEGEISRRAKAQQADAASHALLRGANSLLLWLALLFASGAASIVSAAFLFWRINRARAAAVYDLKRSHDDLLWYARVIQATQTMLITTDLHGRVTWVNDAFVSATGWQAEEIFGKAPGEFLRGPATDLATVEEINAAIVGQRGFCAEFINYKADGQPFWVSLDFSPIQDLDGRAEGFFAILSDITERKKAELLVNEARTAAEDSAREKATFMATMSHEIRTPLNSIIGFTELLLTTDLDTEQRDYVDNTHRSGGHLLALINDVLDYSALESGRMEYGRERFSVAVVLHEVEQMFLRQTSEGAVTLSVRVDPLVPATVIGDAMRLRQVLVNVVGNAVKFTEQGGIAIVVTAESEGDRIRLTVGVEDTGIGIPSYRLPYVFESFVRGDISTTRAYGGTGLGLAICRQLVGAMGGEIEISSEVGRGTQVRFSVVVDLVVEELAGRPSSGEAGADVRVETLRVLVAEDDPVNRKVITRMLERCGIEPDVVENGRQAVEACDARSYDVVLLDVEMPVMDGLRAVSLIRAHEEASEPDESSTPARRTRVIAVTANALPGDRERFLASGMDDYVTKPVTLRALRSALGRSTGEAQTAGADADGDQPRYHLV